MQEIICVLDKSGSMRAVADDAVGGFNAFLETQKKVGPANLTVVWFDEGFMVGYSGPLQECQPLERWPDGGMTALTDAIGKTFNLVRDRFDREKPEKVVMAILTDGQENSSVEFDKEMVASLIVEHETKYNWDVHFLAANQDAWATGQQYGMKQANTVNVSTNDMGQAFDSYSASVTRSRMG